MSQTSEGGASGTANVTRYGSRNEEANEKKDTDQERSTPAHSNN